MKRYPPSQNTQLLNWLNSTINVHEVQIQQLGNGVSYCLLMYHYFPTIFNIKKVCLVPRAFVDSLNNLKALADVLSVLKWSHVVFDINRVATGNYHDNLQLLSKLYSSFSLQDSNQSKQRSAKPSPAPINQIYSKHTPTYRFPQPTNISQQGHQLTQMPKLLKGQSLNQSESSVRSTSIQNKQSSNIIEQIKTILKQKDKTDKNKVKQLKLLLGIEVETVDKSNFQEEADKNLLSEYNAIDQAVIIDDQQ